MPQCKQQQFDDPNLTWGRSIKTREWIIHIEAGEPPGES